MRTSMTYPIRFWALILGGLLLYQFSTEVPAESCKYEKQIDLTLNLSSAETLSILAAAGDLDIVGVDGYGQAVISGKVCASKEEWLEESEIVTSTGKHAKIIVDLPDINGGWSITGNRYAWMDLRVEVPPEIALEVKDSSGDMSLKNTGSVNVQDSSGDIEIESATGLVSISDSSGDIEVDGILGDLTIESDSSGDIDAEDIDGDFLVEQDSSGDIDARNVTGNVVVERDSSGDINAKDVDGDFLVLKDGSGRITSRNIEGEVKVPEKG